MSDKDKQNGQPTPPPVPLVNQSTPAPSTFVSRLRDAIKEIKFRTSKKIQVEGEPAKHVPDERPMRIDDVLSHKEVDGHLVIVSADGRKHRIKA